MRTTSCIRENARSVQFHLQHGGRAVILAEEWHTVHTVLHLDWLLRQAQGRPQVTMLWNANNRTVEPVDLLDPTGLGSESKRRQMRW